ncbi:MAG: TorF family putative porin [Rhizobiaceae bacterium]
MRLTRLAASTSLLFLLCGLQGALAADDMSATPHDNRVEFAWGAALTSNYMVGGETQSADKPAFQAYGEISSGIVYAGIWFSTVELDPDRYEYDTYFGIRPQFGNLSLDAAYYRYWYDDTGNCCGEWIVKADLELSEPLTVQAGWYWDPQSPSAFASAGLELTLSDNWSLSATYKDDLESHDSIWDAGLTWSLTDEMSLDFRYHDSERFDERYVVTLAWDFSTAQ